MKPGPGNRIAACDTVVALASATRGGSTLFAKNSDRPPGECQPLCLVERADHAPDARVHCQYIEIPQVRRTARVLGSRPVWLWGFEHGVNEYGLAVGNETIFARETPASRGLLGMDLVRLALERATNADEALDVLTSLIEQHGQGGSGFREFEFPYNSSFLVADPDGAWILEALGRHWAARRCRSTDAISNQITIASDWERLSEGIREYGTHLGLDVGEPFDFAATFRDVENIPRALSEGRLRRSRTHLAASEGRLDVALICELLRDHDRSGRQYRPGAEVDTEAYYTVCMHEGLSRTTASLIAGLESGGTGLPVVWASFGRPCCSVFFPVVVAERLPAAFTEGSDEPTDVLWWVFEKIALAVEQNPKRADDVRAVFDPLEATLLDDGRRAAADLAGLSGAGAERYAEAFLADVAERVGQAARRLLTDLATTPGP